MIEKAEDVSHKLSARSQQNAVIITECVPDIDSITEPESSHSSESVLDQFGIFVVSHLNLDHSVLVHHRSIFHFWIKHLDEVNTDITRSDAGVDIVPTDNIQSLSDIITILPGHLDTMNSQVRVNSEVNTSSSFNGAVQECYNGFGQESTGQVSKISQMN